MEALMKKVSIVRDPAVPAAVTSALEALQGWDSSIKNFSHILIKPNLCGGVAGEPGSHTGIAALEAVLAVFSSFGLPLFIGEADCSFNDADAMFKQLRIHELAKKFNARVVNLSEGPSIDVAVPDPNNIKTLRIAAVLSGAFILSVPVLKTHPWSGITITMKNMYGATYPREKSVYHSGLEENIVDINRVIGPHLSIVDATVAVVRGGFKYGLWVGCPPSRLDCIIAGVNPVAVDAVGTKLLKREPESIGHIRIAAQQKMGTCDLREITLAGNGSALLD
jgi:uncharacterized protein (DUF362 family)